MKVTRGFNIDVEIDERLTKEENRSLIVNDLLRKHFAEDLTKDELETQKINTQTQLDILNRKMQKINKELKEWQSNKIKGMVVRHT